MYNTYRNIPAGVLYDLFHQQPSTPTTNNNQYIPSSIWPLTLHFTGFPSTILTAYHGDPSLQSSLINSLKEASFIACGTAKPVMDIIPQARDDLWRSIVDADHAQYRMIMDSLPLRNSDIKSAVPVRVLCVLQSGRGGYVSSYESIAQTSRPVHLKTSTASRITLREAIEPIVEKWVSVTSTLHQHHDNDNDGGNMDKISSIGGTHVWNTLIRAVSVGGIMPPGDALLIDLHRDLHDPDFFLYIVVHLNTSLSL